MILIYKSNVDSPGGRHPFGVCSKRRVLASINPPQGCRVSSTSGQWPRVDEPLHRHSPPQKSGFGTDGWAGVRVSSRTGDPPVPEMVQGSVTNLLQVTSAAEVPFACGPPQTTFPLGLDILPPLESLHRMQDSGGVDLGFSGIGSARRISVNACVSMHDSMGSC